MKAKKLLTSLLVRSFQQFQGFVAPGQLVLLQWCAFRFAWFWGLFSVVQDIFLGVGFEFWGVVQCMMPMGPGPPFPPSPDGLECWAFCLGDFQYPYVEASLVELAGASPHPGGAYCIFSLGYNQGIFSLCIFCTFICSFVFVFVESICISLHFRILYFGLISSYLAITHCISYSTLNKVDYYSSIKN